MSAPQNSFPTANISNGLIEATVCLPDIEKGFYRSTRFDWAGIIAGLAYKGHQFYGPWFTRSDPPVWDFEYRGADLVTGAQSTITGPAEEFWTPQGYEEAMPGDTFVKVGVGVLRRKDEKAYSLFENYDFVDHGTWTSRPRADGVEFTHEVLDPASGYGYAYRKTVRLAKGRPELIIEHRLTNTGNKPIVTDQYNHNFLVLDGAAPGPDFVITVPFQIKADQQPDPALAKIEGNQIMFTRLFEGEDKVHIAIEGFSNEARDYDAQIENLRTGASVRMTADVPMASMALWSIRSNISLEPFVDASTEPGETIEWTLRYEYGAAEG